VDRNGTTDGAPDRPSAAAVARLHLHRGPAATYAVLALLLLVVLGLGVTTSLADGHVAAAVVATLVGLAVVGFLGLLAVSIAAPGLTVTPAGVAGRISWVRPVDVDWDAVTIDLDEGGTPGRFRVGLGAESVTLDRRAWFGFGDFVLVVASTPAATGRLSPAARSEVARLLGITRPD
jgi:hypothetical protein